LQLNSIKNYLKDYKLIVENLKNGDYNKEKNDNKDFKEISKEISVYI
jgi:hypothetical protein